MPLKVICLNMWLGGKLFENIQSFIANENADMLCLQEVYNAESYPTEEKWHLVGNLAKMLGYQHYAFTPAFSRTEPSGFRLQNGNAILSRFPLKSSDAIFYDIPFDGAYIEPPGDYQRTPRNLQHAQLEVAGQTLHIFNTQGIWGFDSADSERRLQMGETIARQVVGKRPALLMGDFNIHEATQTIGKIEEHMTNIFKGQLKTSFNLQQKTTGNYGTTVVDMMFTSPDVKVMSQKVASENVSDHLALVAEFELG